LWKVSRWVISVLTTTATVVVGHPHVALYGCFLCSPPTAIVVGGEPHVALYVGKGHLSRCTNCFTCAIVDKNSAIHTVTMHFVVRRMFEIHSAFDLLM